MASSLNYGMPDVTVQWFLNTTDLAANTDQELVCPCDGYIKEIRAIVQAAVTTGGTIQVKTGAALATTVAGAVITVGDAATKGTTYVATATAGSATRKVSKGDRIGLDLTSFATAGALQGSLIIESADNYKQPGYSA